MKSSKILWGILLLILIVITIFFLCLSQYNLALFGGLFVVFTLIILFRISHSNSSPIKKYESDVYNILRTYDSILVEVKSLPDLSEKNVIKTMSFKDIANAEYEIRKPVYFIHNDDSYDFIISDESDAYTYTIKSNDDVKSQLELYFEEQKIREMYLSSELDKLDDLDKTTVIKLDDDKKVKVSPVRKKKVEQ